MPNITNYDNDTKANQTFTSYFLPDGRVNLDIFKFIYNYRHEHEDLISNKKDKIITVLRDLLNKTDPKTFKVNFTDKSNKSSSYTITVMAHYYGDLLRVAKLYIPDEISNYKQNIINFIPYAYSDDQQAILDLVKTITDEELAWVNSVFLDKQNNARYLITSGYLYLVSEFKSINKDLMSPVPVLKDLTLDDDISVYDRRTALENLQSFHLKTDNDYYTYLKKIFEEKVSISEQRQLIEEVNSQLISIYMDKDAINWTFNELTSRAFTSQRNKEGMSSSWVTDEMEELTSLRFARSLTTVKDTSFQQNFLKLLIFSFELLQQDYDGYYQYANYLQRIVITYAKNNGLETLDEIISWTKEKKDFKGANWLLKELQLNKLSLISENNKKEVASGINELIEDIL